jgi:porphobilinogen synthase
MLDNEGYKETPIMGYSAKFASAFYGPFREAADSVPQFGNRRGYQLDPANAEEALREVADDIKEGADIVMVKPGLPYLDILWQVKEKFNMPTAAYCVSGEYTMLETAIQKGWLSKDAIHETLISLRRAGADLIITYWAMKIAPTLSS